METCCINLKTSCTAFDGTLSTDVASAGSMNPW
jgi:hypothetical protein